MKVIILHNSQAHRHITADRHQFHNCADHVGVFCHFSGILICFFSVIFNNQTCILNKTTDFIPCIRNKTLKPWWIHVHIYERNVILLYEAVNKSDTESGCKPHCNEVSGDHRRGDEQACVRLAAVFMTLLNWLCSYNESDLRQRTSYFDVSSWFHSLQKMLRFHALDLDCKQCLVSWKRMWACEVTRCPLLECFRLTEISLHLLVSSSSIFQLSRQQRDWCNMFSFQKHEP